MPTYKSIIVMKYTNMKNSENIYKHDVQEKPINEKKDVTQAREFRLAQLISLAEIKILYFMGFRITEQV